MTIDHEHVPFNSPAGLARSYGIPSQYAAQLHELFYIAGSDRDQTIIQTDFENIVLPLSRLLGKVFSEVAGPSGKVQFVHPACGSKGAQEAWAAQTAGYAIDPAHGLQVRSMGIDPSHIGIGDSLVQTDELKKRGLFGSTDAHFEVGDAADPRFLEKLDPSTPLVVFLRHPEHRQGRGTQGFDYQGVFNVWAQAVSEFTSRGVNAVFLVSDPENSNNKDHLITAAQMERARAVVDQKGNLSVVQFRNPHPTRLIQQQDGMITIVAPKATL